MTRKQRIVRGASAGAAIGIAGGVLAILLLSTKDVRVLAGAVVRDDADPRKQVPIVGAEITADVASSPARSESSGFFHLNLRPGVETGRSVLLHLRHPEYEPLNIYQNAGDGLYVIRMTPLPEGAPAAPAAPEVTVSNVRLRYAVTSRTTVNVGSMVKTFEVVNRANVRCERGSTCSPDGKWKAAIAGTSLDAGAGNELEDARVSCIAGPCAFTKIENDNYSRGGRTISVSVLNWSDTCSFLLEAQVIHTWSGDVIRRSYPARFGPGMNFTLPALAQGPSIEAEINGAEIVYPLGPNLILSWATCSVKVDADRTKLFHCDLKPGYRFQ